MTEESVPLLERAGPRVVARRSSRDESYHTIAIETSEKAVRALGRR